jgi:uncharacterized protein Yka (UPF0111/DUF47 family)
MKKIMRWLVPKEKEFLEMLAEQSGNVLEASKELKKLLDDYSEIERGERKARAYAVKKIEHRGDETTKRIFERLNGNFRTFIDKEHIRQMAIILDDIIDLINIVASRFVILSIERIDDYMLKLVAVINSIASEVNEGILDLKKMKNMEEHCRKIRELEKKADNIYQSALSDLFHFYKNSIDIIKNKEIYDFLENTADRCKDLANVLDNIAADHP